MSKLTAFFRFAESGISSGGYKRASNIQSAKFQLEGLGIAWKDIYGDIDYAVTNTAYSLDAAAKVAAQLSASGLKPGQAYIPTSQKNNKEFTSSIDTLAMTLRAISGTASMTNADYAEIGKIITNMKSRGRIFTTDINSLSERGLGVKGLLADYLNDIKYKGSTKWTESKVADEISKKGGGSISPDILIEMLYEKFGEFATKANETLDGVTANLRSAFARIGEKFFEPIIKNAGPLVNLIDSLRIHINALNNAIGPVVSMIGKDIGGLIQDFASKFYTEEEMKDANGKVVTDPNTGEVMKKKVLRKDTIFYPLFEEKEYKKLVKVVDDYYALPEYVQKQIRANGGIIKDGAAYYEVIEKYSNSGRVLFNVWSSVKNIFGTIGDSILNIARGLGFASEQTSFMDVLVSGTEKLRKATESFRNFMGQSKLVQFLLSIGKAMGGIINISRAFFNSVYNHIIAPIFGKAAKVLPKVSLIERLTQFNQRLYLLGEKIKNSEDFFGPFIERFKAGASAFWEWIKSWGGKLAEHLSNFFEPIKNIFSNSDMTFIEKLKAVKDYLKEDFIMPGWEKVKSVFEGIADAIGKVVNWFKKLFGIGGEGEFSTEEGVLPTMASGNTKGGTGGAFGLLGSLSYVNGGQILSLSETLKTAGANIEEGGDSTLSIFEKFKEFFSKADFSPMALALTAVSVAVTAIAGALLYTLLVLPTRLMQVTKILPEFMNAITQPFSKFNTTMRSISFKNNSEAIKNIGIGLLTIIGAVTAIVVITKVAKISWKDIAIATAYVISIFAILAVSVALMAKAANKMHNALTIDLKNWKWEQFGNQFGDMAKVIMTLIKGVAAFIAVALALGIIVKNDFLAGALDDGLKKLLIITAAVVTFTIVIPGLLSKVPQGMIFKTSGFLSAAATVTSIITAVISLTTLAVIMKFVKWETLLEGLGKIATVATVILVILAGINLIQRIAKVGGMSPTKTLGGLALAISAMAFGILTIIVAMKILMLGLNSTNIDAFKFAASTIENILVIVGLMAAGFMYLSSKNSIGKNMGTSMLAVATAIVSMGAALTLIVISIAVLTKLLSNSELHNSSIMAIWVIVGLIVGMAGAMYAMFKVVKGSKNSFKSVIGAIAAMSLGIAVIAGSIAVLSFIDKSKMEAAAGVIFTMFGTLAVAVIALMFVNKSYGSKNIAMVIATVAALSGAILIISLSIMGIMAVMKKTEVSLQAVMAIIGGLTLVIVAMGTSMYIMGLALKNLNGKNAPKAKDILSMAALYLAVGMSVGIMVASLALLNRMNVGQIVAGGIVVAALAGLTLLISYAMTKIVGGQKVSWDDAGQAIVMYAAISASLFILASAIKLLASVDIGSMTMATLMLGLMGLAVAGIAAILAAIANSITNTLNMESTIVSYLAITGSLYVIALSIKKLAGLSWAQIKPGLKAMLSVVALLGVVMALFTLLGSWSPSGMAAGVAAMLAIAGVIAAIGLTAFLVAKGIELLVNVFDAFVKKQDEWLKDGTMTKFETFLSGLFTSVANAVTNSAGAIGRAAVALVMGLVNGLLEAAGELGLGIFKALQRALVVAAVLVSASSWLGELFVNVGVWLGEMVASGLNQAIRNVLKGPIGWVTKLAMKRMGYTPENNSEWIQEWLNNSEKLQEWQEKYDRTIIWDPNSKALNYEGPAFNYDSEAADEFLKLQEDFERDYDQMWNSWVDTVMDDADEAAKKRWDITDQQTKEEFIRRLKELVSEDNPQYQAAKEMLAELFPDEEQTEEKADESANYIPEYVEKYKREATRKAEEKAAQMDGGSLGVTLANALSPEDELLKTNFEDSATLAIDSYKGKLESEIAAWKPIVQRNILAPLTVWESWQLLQVEWAGINIGDALKRGVEKSLAIESPSKEMVKDMGYVQAGILDGVDMITPSVYDAGYELGDAIGDGVSDSVGDMDLSGLGVSLDSLDFSEADMNTDAIADSLKSNITSNLPSIDELKGYVGLDKGLMGNIEGIKAAWGRIKSSFSEFDVTNLFSGIFSNGLDVNNLTSQFGADFDISSFGYTQSMDTSAYQIENFNPNDYLDSSSIDLDLVVDTSQLDALNKSMSLGTGYFGLTGIAGGSGGNTTINNYNYVQNNTSSGALNTRELNRSTELALTRNRWQVGKGGFYR